MNAIRNTLRFIVLASYFCALCAHECINVVNPTFEDKNQKKCCIDAFEQDKDCKSGCYNCVCTDGSRLCGCAHQNNVQVSDKVATAACVSTCDAVQCPTFENNNQEKCCLDAWGKGATSCQSGCYNCQCEDGSTLCGCAHVNDVTAMDIDDYNECCGECADIACDTFFEDDDQEQCCLDAWGKGATSCNSGCYNCQCEDGSRLCGCAHKNEADQAKYELCCSSSSGSSAHSGYVGDLLTEDKFERDVYSFMQQLNNEVMIGFMLLFGVIVLLICMNVYQWMKLNKTQKYSRVYNVDSEYEKN